MERKISFSELQKAVDEAYEQFKSDKEGAIDSRNIGAEVGKFGISVMLTDGRTIDKADVDVLFPLGAIAKLPVSAVLFSQNSKDEVVKKSGSCACHAKKEKEKVELPFGRHGLRAVSAIEPSNDPEGKYDIISSMIANMTGGAAGVLNDKIYQQYKAEVASDNVADKLAQAGYYLYDQAATAIEVYTKLLSLQLTTKQLAAMGATVAADGRNPITGQYAFDGANSQSIVALMATRGKHFIKPWMVKTGMPVKKGFGGGMVAVLPGFGAIAAFAPEVDQRGVSVKAANAIAYIANKLGLSVYASARVSVE